MHFVPINFSDPGFNPAYTADFQLVIILDSSGFGYAVIHPITNQIIRVKTGNLLKELFDPQNEQTFFTSNYKKVIIAADTSSFCLIPNAVFTPENSVDFAAFLSVKEADLILTDQLPNRQNTAIFTLPEVLVKQIEAQFPSATIQFAPKSWIKNVFDAKIPGQNLYLFVAEKTLKIVYPDQENIRFYNQFDCSEVDEILYFTALVANQLHLKPEETNLILCGSVEADGRIVLRLQAFFTEVGLFSTLDFEQKYLLQQHQVIQFLGLN